MDQNNIFTRLSKAVTISSCHATISPCSKFVASAQGTRLTVRTLPILEVLYIFPCVDKIEKIEFSPDSNYILCGLYGRCTVQLFLISDTEWNGRINENIAGLTSAKWSSDCQHIITVSDFGIQMGIWSLADSSVYLISSPKMGRSSFSFSDCGRFMAVALRMDCKDHIGVYSTADSTWAELSKFRCRSTDAVAVQWSPSGGHIIVVDSPMQYRLLVYTPSGEEVACIEAYTNALGIRSVAFPRPPSHSIITTDSSSNTNSSNSNLRLLAVSSYDGVVRLLSPVCWRIAFVLPMIHPREMRAGFGGSVDDVDGEADMGSDVITTVETLQSDGTDFDGDSSILTSRTALTSTGIKTLTGQPSRSNGNGIRSYVHRSLKILPRTPNSQVNKVLSGDAHTDDESPGLSWSPCGRYLATLDPEHSPRCLWIWNAVEGRLLSLLVQLEPITHMQWRPYYTTTTAMYTGNTDTVDATTTTTAPPPYQPTLTFCTGTPRVYFWKPESGSESEHSPYWTDIPPSSTSTSIATTPLDETDTAMSVTTLRWSTDGRRLLLIGKGGEQSYCMCCYPNNEEIITSSVVEGAATSATATATTPTTVSGSIPVVVEGKKRSKVVESRGVENTPPGVKAKVPLVKKKVPTKKI
eukprot:gene2829-5557_t